MIFMAAVKENAQNFARILDKTGLIEIVSALKGIFDIDFTFCCDSKAMHLLAGMAADGAVFPCVFCTQT